MQAEDTSRTRLIIAVSVMEQCNAEKLSKLAYWDRFAKLYDERVPGEQGQHVAELMQAHVL